LYDIIALNKPSYINKNGGIARLGQEAFLYFLLKKNKIRRKIKNAKIIK